MSIFTNKVEKPYSVLVVFAHPDDEALLCFGTLAKLRFAGATIHLLFLTNGGQGRDVKTSIVADILSASYKILDYNVGTLVQNRDLVNSIENHISATQPSILITHSRDMLEHQDHLVGSKAATLAGRRHETIHTILYAEPVTKYEVFEPNLFVNIDSFIGMKIEAINHYRMVLDRWYMHPQIIKLKALAWSLQVMNSEEKQSHYEAFEAKFLKFD